MKKLEFFLEEKHYPADPRIKYMGNLGVAVLSEIAIVSSRGELARDIKEEAKRNAHANDLDRLDMEMMLSILPREEEEPVTSDRQALTGSCTLIFGKDFELLNWRHCILGFSTCVSTKDLVLPNVPAWIPLTFPLDLENADLTLCSSSGDRRKELSMAVSTAMRCF